MKYNDNLRQKGQVVLNVYDRYYSQLKGYNLIDIKKL